MKQILLKGNSARVEEVPAPHVGERNILVRVHYSCISVGTESANIAAAGEPIFKRALKHPEKVRRALKMVKEQGLGHAVKRISGMLNAGYPTGYSAAGEVVAVGSEVMDFTVGDYVACAGAGIANHAEIIDVPVNLAVRVLQKLPLDQAATVTLGAIALQGIRRTAPTLGETIAVIGLGILGQLTVQMLKANGCQVIGVDIDETRIKIAIESGMDKGLNPANHEIVAEITRATEGIGADAVIVTAAASDHTIISEAMQCCRKKGRLVLVGDVGLNLKREDFYRKEIDFLISTSYGPGRYDVYYEEGGQDYPLPYVRWTENRNMAAYLQMLATRQVRLKPLAPEIFPLEQAPDVYQSLTTGLSKPLLALLQYSAKEEEIIRRVELRSAVAKAGRIQVAIVGAGEFAQGMHLPNLIKLRDDYQVRAVMSRTGSSAKAVANQYEAAYATTDYSTVLQDPSVDLVMITTRHNLHGRMVLDCLRAGKHVFVEKPLAIDPEELEAIENFFAQSASPPVLMTGFNRRFSPAIIAAKRVLADRGSPMIINYRMNAGHLPRDHWVHGPEGGGRNIGEACHIYDLFNYLVESEVVSVHAEAVGKPTSQWSRSENFIATLGYADGSVCSLTYTSMGNGQYPKERMEIFCDGKVFSLDDYRSLTVSGMKVKSWNSTGPEKGQFEELKQLAACLQGNQSWPISLQDQIAATRTSYGVELYLHNNRP